VSYGVPYIYEHNNTPPGFFFFPFIVKSFSRFRLKQEKVLFLVKACRMLKVPKSSGYCMEIFFKEKQWWYLNFLLQNTMFNTSGNK